MEPDTRQVAGWTTIPWWVFLIRNHRTKKSPQRITRGQVEPAFPGRRGSTRLGSSRRSGGERLQLADVGLAALGQQLDDPLLGTDGEVYDLLGDRDGLLKVGLGVGEHGLGLGQLLGGERRLGLGSSLLNVAVL